MKIGIIQQSNSANVEENKQKLAENIRKVAAQGAELVVLQELHNSLYFCQVESTQNFDLAEPIPGPSTDFYGKIAAECNIVLVTSLFEARAKGLYHKRDTVLFITIFLQAFSWPLPLARVCVQMESSAPYCRT
jgi:N-carbamoylputrescine amidase